MRCSPARLRLDLSQLQLNVPATAAGHVTAVARGGGCSSGRTPTWRYPARAESCQAGTGLTGSQQLIGTGERVPLRPAPSPPRTRARQRAFQTPNGRDGLVWGETRADCHGRGVPRRAPCQKQGAVVLKVQVVKTDYSRSQRVIRDFCNSKRHNRTVALTTNNEV